MAKRRTAAQKAATRKLVALNRSRARGAKRRASPKRRRRNPIRAAAPAPARRRRAPARRSYAASTRRSSPVRRRRRSYRRNPMNVRGITNEILIPSLWGAGGAVLNDTAFAYIEKYLPAGLVTQGQPVRYATKAATAVVLTMLGGRMLGKRRATQMGVGAITTLLAEIGRTFVVQNLPGIKMDVGMYTGMYTGEFVSGYDSLGYHSPAMPAGNVSQMGMYNSMDDSPAMMPDTGYGA